MEDTGFLQPLYSDRHDRYELKNFDSGTAQQFAHAMVTRAELSASNMKAFVGRVVELSEGNPGAILSTRRLHFFSLFSLPIRFRTTGWTV
jgi:hypothetical protein